MTSEYQKRAEGSQSGGGWVKVGGVVWCGGIDNVVSKAK